MLSCIFKRIEIFTLIVCQIFSEDQERPQPGASRSVDERAVHFNVLEHVSAQMAHTLESL